MADGGRRAKLDGKTTRRHAELIALYSGLKPGQFDSWRQFVTARYVGCYSRHRAYFNRVGAFIRKFDSQK